MKSKNILLSIMAMVIFLFAGMSSASAQLDAGCPGGTGCDACNATVTKVKLDFQFGDQYFFSSGTKVCGDVCTIHSYLWTVTNAASYTIITEGNGFARIKIVSLPNCDMIPTVPKPRVCLQVRGQLSTAPYTICPWSAPFCIDVPCN